MKPIGTHELLPFLDPPHHHDVTSISNIASIPTCLLAQIPTEVQDALWTLQESTSVIYGSYSRLQALVADRLDRIIALPDDSTSFNEGAFFAYQGQVTNERSYLLDECLADWKHKLLHLGLEQHYDLSITHLGQQMTVKAWLHRLESSVFSWVEEARSTEIPDFAETISEYQSLSTTPTSTNGDNSLANSLGLDDGGRPVKGSINIWGPRKHKTALSREIEEVMGVKRDDS